MSILTDFLKQERARISAPSFPIRKKAIPETEEAKRATKFLKMPFYRQLFTKEFGREVVQFGKEVLRITPRAGGTLSLTAGGKKIFKPETRIERLLFGKEPIRDIKGVGTETLQAFGVSERKTEQFAIPVGIGLTIFDLIPGLPGKKKIPQELAKQLIKRYGKDTAKKIILKGNKKIAEQALKPGGEAVVERLGITVIKKTDVVATQAVKVGKKIVEQTFRGDKLNLPLHLVKQIEKRLSALGLKQRSVRTFKDMEDAAQALGVDPEMLIKEVSTLRITDVEVVALRNTINNNAKFIVKTEKRIVEDAALEVVLRPKIIQAGEQINTALKKLVKGGTEAGRAVASYRIMAQNTLEPSFWLKKANQVLGNRELTSEMQTAILDLIKKSDMQGLANFVSMLRNASNAEKGIALWKAGLLTSPTTHLANIGGNVTMAALMTASDIPSTGLDILISLFTGKRTTTISPATIWAKVKGFGTGVKQAKKYLKTGVYSQELLTKYDLPRKITFKNKILQGYTQTIFRSLGAEDILFRQAALSEALEKQAIVIAKNEGHKGLAFTNRTKELLTKPTNEMVANAIDAAEYATFQNKNPLADLISGGKARLASQEGVTAKGILVGTEVVAPFVRTPTNIAFRIADFSPLGFVKAVVRFADPITRSQKNLVEDLGRAITGTSIIAFGAYLGEKGLMTGNVPTNPAERAQFYAEGKQGNSILINGYWFQLNRVSPFGNLLALGAEFNQLSTEKGGIALIGATVGAGAKGLTEQTFLKGVSGGLKAVQEPERFAPAFIEQTVASVIPTVIGRIARTIDPTLRLSDSIFDSIKSKLPVLSKQLPARKDIWGENVKSPGGKLYLIDPFATKEAVDDPIINEAKSLNITFGMPDQKISGIKLTDEEYSIYQQVQGRILKLFLSRLIESKEYQTLTPTEKEKTFRKYIREVRSQINDSVFPALMIARFELPEDTHPQVLRDILEELTDHNEFNRLNDEEKGKVVRSLLDNIFGE